MPHVPSFVAFVLVSLPDAFFVTSAGHMDEELNVACALYTTLNVNGSAYSFWAVEDSHRQLSLDIPDGVYDVTPHASAYPLEYLRQCQMPEFPSAVT